MFLAPAPHFLLASCCLAVLIFCSPETSAQGVPQTGTAAAIALPAGATERTITFPAAEGLTLPGTLTLPAPDAQHPHNKPPLAVLEQGSGVQDRDATIGPNKLFQQLTWGLAARGIASLRYDRRAKVAMDSFLAHPDLDHEVVLDAVAALAWASAQPDTDPHRLFLIGHSLGAQLAPDIVAARLRQTPGSVAGLALLAGIARPIDQVMHDQMATLGTAQGGTPEQIAHLQAQYDTIWATARDPGVADKTPSALGGGITVGYMRDWIRRDPATVLAKLQLPAFIARGTKDLNTTHGDFVLLKAAATAPGSEALEFPDLSHLFIPIAGQPTGRDTAAPGTISPLLLDALARWLLQVPPSHP